MALCSLRNLKVPVELPFLLVFFSFFFTSSVFLNFDIYRTCYTIMGYNQSLCALLGQDTNNSEISHLETLVEPKASIIAMTRSIIVEFLSAFLCIFLGPWSDKFGRKSILLLSTFGLSCSYFLVTTFSFFPNISPWYFLICYIPAMITGGGSSFISAVLSYIADVTTEETRGIRMGVFEVTFALSILLGNALSSYIFYATSYSAVFAIAAGCCVLSFVIIFLLVPESLSNVQTQGKLSGFFSFSNVIEMIKTTIKRRDNNKRILILSSFVIIATFLFCVFGDGSVNFLFVREKFEWSLKDYTTFNSVTSVTGMLGTIFGIYLLHKILKITEVLLVFLGFMSVFTGALVQGLATQSWHLYFAGLIRSLGGVISPMTRTLLSKLVPVDELGKVFSLLVICESLFGLLATPTYTAIYNKTINTDPASYNFVTAGIYLFNLLVVSIMIVLKYRNRSFEYRLLEENVESTNNVNN